MRRARCASFYSSRLRRKQRRDSGNTAGLDRTPKGVCKFQPRATPWVATLIVGRNSERVRKTESWLKQKSSATPAGWQKTTRVSPGSALTRATLGKLDVELYQPWKGCGERPVAKRSMISRTLSEFHWLRIFRFPGQRPGLAAGKQKTNSERVRKRQFQI